MFVKKCPMQRPTSSPSTLVSFLVVLAPAVLLAPPPPPPLRVVRLNLHAHQLPRPLRRAGRRRVTSRPVRGIARASPPLRVEHVTLRDAHLLHMLAPQQRELLVGRRGHAVALVRQCSRRRRWPVQVQRGIVDGELLSRCLFVRRHRTPVLGCALFPREGGGCRCGVVGCRTLRKR